MLHLLIFLWRTRQTVCVAEVSRAGRGGFSLFELALVVTIISVVAGGLLTVSSVQEERNYRLETLRRMDVIEAALQRHAYSMESLPCPAPANVNSSNATYGIASVDCTGAAPAGTVNANGTGNESLNIGAVPTRTLNLPDMYMVDGWNNRFTYSVIKPLTAANGVRTYATTATNNVTNVLDGAAAANQVNDANTQTIIPYILISHGKNGMGAYTRDGAARTCSGSAREVENCDNDISFVDTRQSDSTTATNGFYDDYVRWKPLPSLIPIDTNLTNSRKVVASSKLTRKNTIAISSATSFAIGADGRLYSWGFNDSVSNYGLLGRGPNIADPSALPTVMAPDITDWSYITSYTDRSCALRSNGMGYCWGDNQFGQNGNGTITATNPFPTLIAGGILWQKISMRFNHMCGLSVDQRVYCWGQGNFSQNGSSTFANLALPRPIDSNTDWTDIATGQNFNCGIRNAGQIFCWGSNVDGPFGNGGSSGTFSTPQAGGNGFTDWVKISAKSSHVCAIRANRELYCWGRNEFGQSGQGTLGGSFTTPQRVGAAADWDEVFTSATAAFGIRGGLLYAWGTNDGGRMGVVSSYTPVQIPTNGINDWVEINGNDQSTCAVSAKGGVYCWGENSNYELGLGHNVDTTAITGPVLGIVF
ncbi:MAG: hypothetical protein K2Q12_09770 [Rickettsiales bacterium]|nr:hypothetical protein [Rickettsiales bacterium]